MPSCQSLKSILRRLSISRSRCLASLAESDPRRPAASCSASCTLFPPVSRVVITSAAHVSRATATRSRACVAQTTASTFSVVFLPAPPGPSPDLARASHSDLTSPRNRSSASANALRSTLRDCATAGRRNSSAYLATSLNTWCGCAMASAESSPRLLIDA